MFQLGAALPGSDTCNGGWLARWRPLLCLLVIFVVSAGASASAMAKPLFSAIAVDARTGQVLFARDADGIRHPASLTKVMTLYVLFQDLKAGRVKLDSPLRISSRAASMAPSKLGARAGTTITVDQAIRALVTKSANDVAAAIAENLGGSESQFAARMTKTAKLLGMSRTVYRNASGLPNPQQVTTARDIAILSLRIQRDFPEYYPYFRIASFTFKGQTIRTHNRLLGRYAGTDGIKTGYIRASGFNLTTSVKRGDKRIVGVVLGATSGNARNRYMMAMLDQTLPKCVAGKTIVATVGTAATSTPAPMQADMSPNKLQKRLLKGKAVLPNPTPDVPAAAEPDTTDEDAAEGATEINENDKSALNTMIDQQQQQVPQPPAISTSVQSQAPLPAAIPFEIKDAAPALAAITVNSWHIQIGAYPTKLAAQAKINLARQTVAKELEGKQGFTMAVQKGQNTVYRARFSGFSEDAAKVACRHLESRGIQCMTLSPQG